MVGASQIQSPLWEGGGRIWAMCGCMAWGRFCILSLCVCRVIMFFVGSPPPFFFFVFSAFFASQISSQHIWFVVLLLFMNYLLYVMDWPGLCLFCCYQPCALSANIVDLVFSSINRFSNFTPPPPHSPNIFVHSYPNSVSSFRRRTKVAAELLSTEQTFNASLHTLMEVRVWGGAYDITQESEMRRNEKLLYYQHEVSNIRRRSKGQKRIHGASDLVTYNYTHTHTYYTYITHT